MTFLRLPVCIVVLSVSVLALPVLAEEFTVTINHGDVENVNCRISPYVPVRDSQTIEDIESELTNRHLPASHQSDPNGIVSQFDISDPVILAVEVCPTSTHRSSPP